MQSFFSSFVSDLLTDIGGRLIGESIVKASFKGTYSGFYVNRHLVSTSISRIFGSQNHCELEPISTEVHPWMGWKHIINHPSMSSFDDFCSICVVIEEVTPNIPVCSNIIIY